MTGVTRRAKNLTLDIHLLAEAEELKINVSRAAESGLAAAIRKERERQWQEDNAEAIRSSNEWVEKNGLPLEKYRPF